MRRQEIRHGRWETGDSWKTGDGRQEMGVGRWELGVGRWELGDVEGSLTLYPKKLAGEFVNFLRSQSLIENIN